MTLFQVEELTAYWAHRPPVHLLVAAYLGLGKGKRLPETPPVSPDNGDARSAHSASLLTRLGPGFAGGDVHAGLPPAVLDFAELQGRATSTE